MFLRKMHGAGIHSGVGADDIRYGDCGCVHADQRRARSTQRMWQQDDIQIERQFTVSKLHMCLVMA